MGFKLFVVKDKWLLTVLDKEKNKQANFGKITYELHNALIDDPEILLKYLTFSMSINVS